jgi:hypothetical protein
MAAFFLATTMHRTEILQPCSRSAMSLRVPMQS